MALGARFVDGFEVEEMLVLGPVRPMAARALQGEVSIPGILDLRSDGMRRMRLPLMAVPTEIELRGFVQEKDIVGAVR
jgi:hypothetical protein